MYIPLRCLSLVSVNGKLELLRNASKSHLKNCCVNVITYKSYIDKNNITPPHWRCVGWLYQCCSQYLTQRASAVPWGAVRNQKLPTSSNPTFFPAWTSSKYLRNDLWTVHESSRSHTKATYNHIQSLRWLTAFFNHTQARLSVCK